MTETTDEPGDRRVSTERPSRGMSEVRTLTNKFARLVIIGMLVQLGVIVYVFATEHNGRQDAVNAAREGCKRDVLDRQASVTLNENILKAFREGQKQAPQVLTPTRKKAVEEIESTTAGLDERAHINCLERYPDAGWFP